MSDERARDERALSCAEVDDLAGLFVLDALDQSEADAVAAHLATCEASHTLYAELASSAVALALTVAPQDAPADLRDRVLTAVSSTPQIPLAARRPVADVHRSGQAQRALGAASVEGGQEVGRGTGGSGHRSFVDRVLGRRSDRGPRRAVPRWALVAVPVVAVVLLLAGAVGLWQRQAAETDRLALLRQAIAAAADPAATVAVLSGSDAAAGAAGYAVFPADGDGYIVVDGLPSLAGDRVYQAWFVGGGDPVSAGLIDLGSDGLGVLTGLRIMPDTAVVALSVEARPGATSPTTTPLVVGEIRAGAPA